MTETLPNAGLADKNVSIVCGHFMPEIGYQEVDLARAFARLQAHVTVITSNRVSPGSRAIIGTEYPAGECHEGSIKVIRIKPLLSGGANVVAAGVSKALSRTDPDYCVLIGPGKLFGIRAFCSAAQARRISIFQENSEDGRSRQAHTWRGRGAALGHWLVKRKVYSRVISASHRIVCNVPETKSILRPWLSASSAEALDAYGVDLRLGFDPEQFAFLPHRRREIRRQLDVGSEELLICTCTRAVKSKRLEDLVQEVRALREAGFPVRYAIAGVMDDAYGKQLRRLAATASCRDFVSLLPVLSRSEMSGFYSAADLGLWPQAAITIQQAMGTGLPIVLKNRKSVSHLLQHGVTGWYVKEGDSWGPQLAMAVKKLVSLSPAERNANRQQLIVKNANYLSYDQVALDMVRNL